VLFFWGLLRLLFFWRLLRLRRFCEHAIKAFKPLLLVGNGFARFYFGRNILGGIAIDAPEADVISNAAMAKARTFAMMTLSSSNKLTVDRGNPQPPFDLDPLRSFGISAAA
jgi:hypothetical protein